MRIMGGDSAWAGVRPYAEKTGKTGEDNAAFLEQMQRKEASDTEQAQEKESDQDEKAFEMMGPNAPQKVKDAWMAAAKEVRANGMGIGGNGMMSHISQMMVQRLTKMIKGEGQPDVLGNTVGSAIRATKQALYDLEHPIAHTPKSIAVQQAQMKEKEFYEKFLEKLSA